MNIKPFRRSWPQGSPNHVTKPATLNPRVHRDTGSCPTPLSGDIGLYGYHLRFRGLGCKYPIERRSKGVECDPLLSLDPTSLLICKVRPKSGRRSKTSRTGAALGWASGCEVRGSGRLQGLGF